MKISNNRVSDTSIGQNFRIKTDKIKAVKNKLNAFRVELSKRALASAEYNSDEIFFPIHNEDALAYTKHLKINYMHLTAKTYS